MTDSVVTSTVSTVKATNVQVAVRCRPLNSDERKLGQPTAIICHPDTKMVVASYGPPNKKITKSFNYDKVFGMYSTQEEVFTTVVRPIVDETLAGFNCTIFAYGQTGTGKTHTMEGDIHSEENAGIVPRSVKYILEQLENSEAEYTIRVSFLELYNEELQDLLNSSKEKKLKLCEDGVKGVVCQNLEEITVLGVSDIFEILQRGIQNRQTAETLCNKNSSRSHSIFTLKIMIKECNVDGEEVVRHGQLNLVDLAGSECVGRSGAKNDRAREAGNINQSLLTLGRVITALVDHHSHVPYRDSKLTRILQESLGGKAKTCIIATLSPSQASIEETLSTLDYAYRAKSIKNQPTVNQKMTKKVVLKEYCAEIEQLRTQLQLTREKNGVYLDPNQFYAMESRLSSQENQIIECETALKQRNDEIKSLKYERDEIVNELEMLRQDYNTLTDKLMQSEYAHQQTKHELYHTQIDLKASEAIVKELHQTECQLHVQGKSLLNEIDINRNHIEMLFNKINEFKSSEKSKITLSETFLNELKSIQMNMNQDIHQIINENTTHYDQLCNGVRNMIQNGQNTCIVLKQSIDNALSKLLGDATYANNDVLISCDDLQGHLHQSYNNNLLMYQKFSEIIDNEMKSMNIALLQFEESVMNQKNDTANYHERLESFNDLITSKYRSYYEDQKTSIEAFSKLIDSFQSSLMIFVSENIKQMKTQAIQANQLLSNQAMDIENKVVSMLRELAKSGSAAFSSIATQADSLQDGVKNVTNEFKVNGSENLMNLTQRNENYTIEITKQLNDLKANNDSYCTNLSKSQSEVASGLNNLSMRTTSFTNDCNEFISQSKSSATQSSEAHNKGLKHISNKASIVLERISNASITMKSDSDNAASEFMEYVQEHGNVLSETLQNHLHLVSDSLNNVLPNIKNVNDIADNHGQSMNQLIVPHSGNTPTKKPFHSLPILTQSREIEIIRKEAKELFKGDVSLLSESIEQLNENTPSINETISEDSSERVSTSSQSSNGSNESKKRKATIPRGNEAMDTSKVVDNESTENANPNNTSSNKIPRGAYLRSKTVEVASASSSIRSNRMTRSHSVKDQDNTD